MAPTDHIGKGIALLGLGELPVQVHNIEAICRMSGRWNLRLVFDTAATAHLDLLRR